MPSSPPTSQLATPRRSALFAPGENARALAKARTLPADLVIIDLEDAVAADNKAAAREAACAALNEDWRCAERLVRVNAPDTRWGEDDLRALADAGNLHGVLLPKVDGVDAVKLALRTLGENPPPLWIMCETPLGVLNLHQVLGARPIAGVVAGVHDLARELRLPPRPDAGVHPGLAHALSRIVLAARAHRSIALDGVYANYQDETGFVVECEAARLLGFDGKTLIHPTQIAAANRVFSPTPAELDQARRTIDAWQAARAESRGVAVLDGRLIESLHVEEAKRLLEMARRLGDGDPVE